MRAAALAISLAATLAAAKWGLSRLGQSGLFVLSQIEVELASPARGKLAVSEEDIRQLSGVKLGRESLYGLDLKAIEARILAQPWIRKVLVSKRFPHSLLVQAELRTPVLGIAGPHGSQDSQLYYLDGDGVAFAPWNPRYEIELPILLGVSADNFRVVRLAQEWAKLWEGMLAVQGVELSSFTWDESVGLRAHISYPLTQGARVDTQLELGNLSPSQAGEEAREQAQRLAQVIKHLGSKGMVAQQIWADLGKKIVVKTAPGS